MVVARRQQILDTAALLFAEHGFHGASVNDIGAACGISGPAIYKHFGSKDEILAASLTQISAVLLETGQKRCANATGPSQALEALIGWHTDFALAHPALIIIQEREWTNLHAAGRSDVRRLQLTYVDLWVDVVRSLRSDLDRAEARAAVQATFGLLNSTPHSARIGKSRMRALLQRLALGALSAPVGGR